VEFFRQFDAIEVSHVRGDAGHFKATLVYHRKDGRVSSPEPTEFELRCTSNTKWRFVTCDEPEEVMIHDTITKAE
jgi:hypothetical protein